MQELNELIKLVKLPKVLDDCVLCFAQEPDHIPFKIKRVFFIKDASTKLPRGFHAHKKTKQVIFCIQGSIKLSIDNGRNRVEKILYRPAVGVFIDKMIWHEMHNFKKNTILLVMTSTAFDMSDYIRDYAQFKKLVQKSG